MALSRRSLLKGLVAAATAVVTRAWAPASMPEIAAGDDLFCIYPKGSTAGLTLADMARQLDPDGRVDQMAALLAQHNSLLDDIVWKPVDPSAVHVAVIATAAPPMPLDWEDDDAETA